jgi:hypothetical protein
MKKLFTVGLLVLALLAMTACGSSTNDVVPTPENGGGDTPQSAYALYMQASQALESAESFLVEMSTEMQMSFLGDYMDMTMSGTLAVVIISETDIQMKMDMMTNSMGMDMPMLIYFKDGYQYTDVMGQKMKMSMPMEEILAQANVSPLEFTESAILNEVVTPTGNGYEVSFTLDGDTLSDIVMQQMAGLEDLFGADMDMTFGDIDMVVLIENNEIKHMVMKFSVEAEYEGDKMMIHTDTIMTYTQIGGVTIDFPDDLDMYEEMSDDLFLP